MISFIIAVGEHVFEAVLNVIIGAVLGAVLSYISSYFVEKKIYERQLRDKIREKFFAPLIDELYTNLEIFRSPIREERDELGIEVRYNMPKTSKWEKIVEETGLLLELGEDLRADLRDFYNEVKSIKEWIDLIRAEEDKTGVVDSRLLNKLEKRGKELAKIAETLIRRLEQEAKILGVYLKKRS